MLKFGIGGKLLTLPAVMFIGFALLASLASWKIYESISTERIDKVRSLTEAAVSMIKTAHARYQSGELSEEALDATTQAQRGLEPASSEPGSRPDDCRTSVVPR